MSKEQWLNSAGKMGKGKININTREKKILKILDSFYKKILNNCYKFSNSLSNSFSFS